jgi:hypothetical protein
MKLKFKFFVTGLLILILSSSCGQVVHETHSPVIPGPVNGEFKKAVILPFADYTPAFSPYGYWRRNVLVLEALQDELYKAGFVPSIYEDLVRYLLKKGIIQSSSELSAETELLQKELEQDYSDYIKRELSKSIQQNMLASNRYNTAESNTSKKIALDNKMLKDIGNEFGADYIVRGRIIEFRSSQENTFDPFRTGILPFVLKTGQRTIFGVAESATYETIDKVAVGAALGAIIGHTDSILKPSDGANYRDWNSLIWGTVGGGAAYLADKGGRVNKATVQLRMLVQDVRTGEIIWLNRAQVSSTPITTYADPDWDELFASAIKQAVKSLVDNFVATLASGRLVKIDKEGLTVSPKVETGVEAEGARGAAYDARQSAHDAEEAALRAEEAAQRAATASDEAKEAVEKANKASAKSEEIYEKTIAK